MNIGEWFTFDNLNRVGAGVVVGASFMFYVTLRVVKSGAIVFGDKAKLSVENAVLQERARHDAKTIASLKKKVLELQSGG